MEQEILSWLNANYETGKETDCISKENLGDEFAIERDVNVSREEFFTRHLMIHLDLYSLSEPCSLQLYRNSICYPRKLFG